MTLERIGSGDASTEAQSERESTVSVTYLLTLFVTGQSVRSQSAIANLRRMCDSLGERCRLTIVDVLERPQLAEREKILATPTVIRHRPLPVRRIIGDLSDSDRVLAWLDLPPIPSIATGGVVEEKNGGTSDHF
jgi:circadian clock protein KaiB